MSLETLTEKVEQLIDLAEWHRFIQTYIYNQKSTRLYIFENNPVEDVSSFDFSQNTVLASLFANNTLLKEIEIDVTSATNAYGMFIGCSNLIYVFLKNTNNVTSFNATFNGCYALVDLFFMPETIYNGLSLGHSSNLSAESIQSIIDGLATVETQKTLTVHPDVYTKITDEQTASAFNKGWVIA